MGDDISTLLHAWSEGDHEALRKLTPIVYNELHRLARRYSCKYAVFVSAPAARGVKQAGQTFQPSRTSPKHFGQLWAPEGCIRGSASRRTGFYRTSAQQLQRFFHHTLGAHPGHPAMIDRALAQ
jgi:hypothetical protein